MDFLPTKGIEYVMALAYLAILVPFLALLRRLAGPDRPRAAVATATTAGDGTARPSLREQSWFRIPQDRYFHRGHTWAAPEADGTLRVGVDDFAHALLGPADGWTLPRPGQRLRGGDREIRARVDGHSVDLLSPVDGEVVEVNEEAARSPRSVGDDPYGAGWLYRVRPDAPRAELNNLLPADLARDWMGRCVERLSAMAGPDVGMVLQDGGLPVPGMARALAGERWADLAAELLLSGPPSGESQTLVNS